MSRKAKKIAKELRDKLLEYDDFIGLYLYGSHAYGKPHKDSDIDIVALFKNDKQGDDNISGKVLNLDIKYDTVIDFQRFTLDDLNLHWTYFDEIKRGIYYAR